MNKYLLYYRLVKFGFRVLGKNIRNIFTNELTKENKALMVEYFYLHDSMDNLAKELHDILHNPVAHEAFRKYKQMLH